MSDRFDVRRRVGAGGAGVVYQAWDKVTGEDVALKVLHGGDELEPMRFLREAQVLAGISHPDVVRYVAHGVADDGQLYLAMEWLEGETLADRLKRAPLTLVQTLTVARHISDALGAIHSRGLVHRDVKPGNIMLVDGEITRVKLLDFGLARSVRQTHAITGTGAMLGTPSFMAPEQARSAGGIDSRADLFALGAIMFSCIAGRPPFIGDDAIGVVLKLLLEDAPRLVELVPDVPPEVDGLVQHLLAKAAENRPEQASLVTREIDLLLATLVEGGPLSERLAFSEGLTTTERRLMCLVMARLSAFGDPEVTLAQSVIAAHASVVHAVLDRFNVRVEILGEDLAIAVLLGTPEASDLAQRGARCALALRAALPESHIVVVSGGEVLGKGKPTGDLVDRGITLLARAETLTLPSVWLDDATAGLLGPELDVRSRAEGQELVGEHAVSPGVRKLLGRAVPCFGRERELATLLAFFDECVSESVARAVLVTAPAGVGKSRIRYELLKLFETRDEPPRVWIARGELMSAGSAFGMLGQLIRRAAGMRDGDPVEVQREALETRVKERVASAEVARVTAFLGEVAGLKADPDGALAMARDSAQLMHDQTLRAWIDFLRAECEAAPLTLVLEDLQWGDLPTIKYLDAALDALAERPLLLLALGRPEVHDIFPRLFAERGLSELKLLELTRRASERVVRSALGDDVSAATVKQIVDRAAGNAFYLEELARSVSERGSEHMPETVLATVQARLEALEPEARQVMRAASVFGQAFWEGGVLALLGGDNQAERLGEWLKVLSERELFSPRSESRFPGERELVFRHALVREGAYATLTERDHAIGHRLAAQWLEQAGETDAGMLAEHFERGQSPASAGPWWERAAIAALHADDLEAAITRANRGIACNAAGDADAVLFGGLSWVKAAAHQWRGENAEAERAGAQALDALPPGSPLWCRAAREVVAAAGRLGSLDRLSSLSEQLVRVAPSPATRRAHQLALAQAAVQAFNAGSFELAARLLARVEDAPEVGGTDPLLAAAINRAHATRAGHVGDLAECLSRTQAAVEQLDAAGDVRTAALQRVNLGYAESLLGLYEPAERHLREALATANELRLHNASAMAKNNLGLVLMRRGRLPEAELVEREAVDAFSSFGDVRMAAASRAYLGWILLELGQLEAAETEAEAAAAGSSSLGRVRAYALAVGARVALVRGDLTLALERAREAMELLESVGVEEGELMVRLAWVDALRGVGELERAKLALTAAEARVRELAEQISDPELRRAFLDDVPEHARTFGRR
ncbi:MAG: protein kinase [Myxococcales bacterium]|nr:protein kinase [Myxococcales bacterium]